MPDLNPGDGGPNSIKNYWTHGPGAAKIRWGTPGDWTRCHLHLAKHVGDDRAKRFCAAWHIEVTGVATGSRLNPGNHR